MADLLSSIELDAALAAGEAAAALTYVPNQKTLALALRFSVQYVSQLKLAGRIKPEPDGTWCVETVKQQISDTSDLGQSMAAETRLKSRTEPAATEPPDMGIPMSQTFDDAAEIDHDTIYTEDHDKNFKIARSLRERELAKTAQLVRLETEGMTVLKADVDRAAYTEARVIRDSIMGFCTKISPLLAPITDPFELERMLREGIRQVLADCVKREEVTVI
jgi:hypothetical protein